MDIKPVAYYCDHRTPGAVPHQSIELPEGEGYQIQERFETLSALTFADQRHYPEHLRDFHCPAAVPLYLPAGHRDQILTEAAALMLHKRDHLNGVTNPAEEAHAILLAARTNQEG